MSDRDFLVLETMVERIHAFPSSLKSALTSPEYLPFPGILTTEARWVRDVRAAEKRERAA